MKPRMAPQGYPLWASWSYWKLDAEYRRTEIDWASGRVIGWEFDPESPAGYAWIPVVWESVVTGEAWALKDGTSNVQLHDSELAAQMRPDILEAQP